MVSIFGTLVVPICRMQIVVKVTPENAKIGLPVNIHTKGLYKILFDRQPK